MDEIATLTLIGHDLCDAVDFVLGSDQDRKDIIDYAVFYAKMIAASNLCKTSRVVILVMTTSIAAIMTIVAIKKVVAARHPPILGNLLQKRLLVVCEDDMEHIKIDDATVIRESALTPKLFGIAQPELLLSLVHLAAQNRAMVFQYLLDFSGTGPTEASLRDALGQYASADDAIAAYKQIGNDPEIYDEFHVWNAHRKIALLGKPSKLQDFISMTEGIIAPWKALTFRTIPCIGCYGRDACRGVIRWVSTHCKYCAYDLGLSPTLYCVYGCDEHFETHDAFDRHVHQTCPIRNPFRCQVKGCTIRFPSRSGLTKHIHKQHGILSLQLG